MRHVRMSRDHKGAVPLRLRQIDSHRVPLLFHDVSNRRRNIIPVQQPSGATVPSPSFSIRLVNTPLVQSPTGIRLEGVHHLLRRRLTFHNHVNMVGSDMSRQEPPSAMPTNFAYGVEYRAARRAAQQIQLLVHQILLMRCPPKIRLKRTMSGNIVAPIHGTGFVAVQVRTITGERDQVYHGRFARTAPSRSRLGKGRSRLGRAPLIVPNYEHNSRLLVVGVT
jgi:hypothetical protein